jgi:hypothetical protein
MEMRLKKTKRTGPMTAKQASAARWRAKQKAKQITMETSTLPETKETDAEIETKLSERFSILKVLANAACNGEARALIVSGPAGLSKSYTVEKALEAWDPSETQYTIVKGYVRATGLYKALWQNRHKGRVLVFDDADTIFFDDTSLNFLKAVLDTTERRRVSYLAETTLIDEETATPIPSTFDFDGSCIFITNYDFDHMIEKGHKLAPHLQALVSRAHYVDLAMKTRRDYFIRIRQVVEEGMLKTQGLDEQQSKEVMDFIEDNINRVRELSLRTAIKVGSIRKFNSDWEKVARVTCLKNN